MPCCQSTSTWESMNRDRQVVGLGHLAARPVAGGRARTAARARSRAPPPARFARRRTPRPAPSAMIWPAVAAACMPRPQTRSCVSAASISRGPRGMRSVGMSDIDSTPPGRRSRNASAKNRAREGKWNAASTLITPSNERIRAAASASRRRSPARAPASASRGAPACNCDRVMLRAVRLRGRRDLGDHADPARRVRCPRRARRHPLGECARRVASTSRRTATGASAGSDPSPSHSPRLSQPGASARKNSVPRLS